MNFTVSSFITKKLAEGASLNDALTLCKQAQKTNAGLKRSNQSEFKSFEIKAAEADEESMTFRGYASTWDMDEVQDMIHAGAFEETIKERLPQNKIKVLWQHDRSIPIGLPVEMSEDEKGLFTVSKISDTTMGRDYMKLIKDGVVDRLSIGFNIAQSEFREDEWTRDIFKVHLFEYSPVTFPANENAVIEMASRIAKNANGETISQRNKDQLKELANREMELLANNVSQLKDWAKQRKRNGH